MENNTSEERIAIFDLLKSFAAISVIMGHAIMSFMVHPTPWWPFVDRENSLMLTGLGLFIDGSIIPLFCFISGYLTPRSYTKRGAAKFIKDKFIHVELPCWLGVLTIAPLFTYLYVRRYLPQRNLDTFLNFISKDFWTTYYDQSYFWYLGVLFLFYVLYVLVARFFPSITCKSEKRGGIPYIYLFVAVVLSVVCFYFIASQDPFEWLNVGYVLYFNPRRIIGYVCFFFMGVFAWRNHWFSKGGWTPKLVPWALVAFVLLLIRFVWFVKIRFIFPMWINLLYECVIFVALSLPLVFATLAFFIRFQKQLAFLERPSRYTYSIYWMHQVFLTPIMYVLIRFHIPVLVKFAIAVIFTWYSCYFVSKYVLEKITSKF